MLAKLRAKLQEKENRDEGFTLLELLVVTIVIAVLVGIAIPSFANQQRTALRASVMSDAKHLQIDVMTYLTSHIGATGMNFARTGSGAAAGTLSGDLKTVASDPLTYIKLRGVTEDKDYGAWNGYGIVATNPNASASGTYYVYYSSDRDSYWTVG